MHPLLLIPLLAAVMTASASHAGVQEADGPQRAAALVTAAFNGSASDGEKVRLLQSAIAALGSPQAGTDQDRARYLWYLATFQAGEDPSAAAETYAEALAVHVRLDPATEAAAKVRQGFARTLAQLGRLDEAEAELRLVLSRPILFEEASLRADAYDGLRGVFEHRATGVSSEDANPTALLQRESNACMAEVWRSATGPMDEAAALSECSDLARAWLADDRRAQVRMRASQAQVDLMTASSRTGESGRLASREETEARVAAIGAADDGAGTIEYARALASLAFIYAANGESLEARAIYADALSLMTALQGADAIETLLLQAGFANALIGAGEIDAGVDLQRQIIAVYVRHGNADDLWAIQFRRALAESLENTGRYEEAEQEAAAMLAILDRDPAYWKDEYLTVALLRSVQLRRLGEYAAAESLLRKAAEVARAEPPNRNLAQSLDQQRGLTLIQAGRDREGITLLRTLAEDKLSVHCPDRSEMWTYDGACTANGDMIFSSAGLANALQHNGARHAAIRLYRHVGEMILARTRGRYSLSAQARRDYRSMSPMHARFVAAAWPVD